MTFLWLMACGPFGLGGDETDGRWLDTAGAPESGTPVEGFDALPGVGSGTSDSDTGEDAPDDSGATSSLTAVGGAGRIDVVHAFRDSCGAQFAGAHATSEGNTLTVVYDVTYAEDTSSDPCVWSLSYALSNLAAGTWTVVARDDSATAEVTR